MIAPASNLFKYDTARSDAQLWGPEGLLLT